MDNLIIISDDEEVPDERQAIVESSVGGDKEGFAGGTVLDCVVANAQNAGISYNGAGTAKRERRRSKYLSGPYTDPGLYNLSWAPNKTKNEILSLHTTNQNIDVKIILANLLSLAVNLFHLKGSSFESTFSGFFEKFRSSRYQGVDMRNNEMRTVVFDPTLRVLTDSGVAGSSKKLEAKGKRKPREGVPEAEAGSSTKRNKVKKINGSCAKSQKVSGSNKFIPDFDSQDPIHGEGLLNVTPLKSLPRDIDLSKGTNNSGQQFMRSNPRIKDLARNVTRRGRSLENKNMESFPPSLPSLPGAPSAATTRREAPHQESFGPLVNLGHTTVVGAIDNAISAMFVARERAVVLEQSAQIAEGARLAADDNLKKVEGERDAALLRAENAEAESRVSMAQLMALLKQLERTKKELSLKKKALDLAELQGKGSRPRS